MPHLYATSILKIGLSTISHLIISCLIRGRWSNTYRGREKLCDGLSLHICKTIDSVNSPIKQ